MVRMDVDGPGRVLQSMLGERNSLLVLQRHQAKFVTEASQIVFHAMGVLARQQAEALHRMFAELPAAPGPDGGAGNVHALGDLRDECLRVSLHAFVTQMKLGLESAAAINAAALELLEVRVLATAERLAQPEALEPAG
jgi:hypothetical protein